MMEVSATNYDDIGVDEDGSVSDSRVREMTDFISVCSKFLNPFTHFYFLLYFWLNLAFYNGLIPNLRGQSILQLTHMLIKY